MTITQQRTQPIGGMALLMLAGLFQGAPPLQAQTDKALVLYSQTIHVGGAALQIDFGGSSLDLPRQVIMDRIEMAAQAVTTYYSKFPVPKARILILGVVNRHGVLQGTTWGNRSGFPAFLLIRIGQTTTQEELRTDWVITHEMVHTALPSLPDDQHWLEEGLASYIEPIARVQAGEILPDSIWADMVRGMPKGEPEAGDRGLDHTHTWGRTYWGGALFCLMADIQIRRQTQNRYGLQDALHAVVAAGGSIDKEWPLTDVLSLGDKATGTHVLSEMYAKWSTTPVSVDLEALWEQLGVLNIAQNTVKLNSTAPLAEIREAIAETSRKFPVTN